VLHKKATGGLQRTITNELKQMQQPLLIIAYYATKLSPLFCNNRPLSSSYFCVDNFTISPQ